MIKTFAELLTAIKEKGVKEIEPFLNIGHNPTIGSMYEGLTKEILNKAIFQGINLKVTSGKVKNNAGKLSRQIDCMIVVGNGEIIPYTNECLYHINDVIAVIEVKKRLYTSDLDSSFYNLKSVVETFEAREDLELSQVIDSYRSIVGEELPERDELKSLSFHKKMIYHTLILESYLPLRIVLGYEGFKSEYLLREGFINYLDKSVSNNKEGRGYGATNFPNLIICDEASIVKLNGMPYAVRTNKNDKWALYASYPKNPMLILLELIWTRLSYKYDLSSDIFGNDFTIENISPFLLATAVNKSEKKGWEYEYVYSEKENLGKRIDQEDIWKPASVSNVAFNIFNRLCNDEKVNFNDINLANLIKSEGFNIEEIEKEIIDTGLVYKSNKGNIHLLTKECLCVIAPQGFLVGENLYGRMTQYIMEYYN